MRRIAGRDRVTLAPNGWAKAPTLLPMGLAVTAMTIYAAAFADAYALRLLTLSGIYALAAIGYQIVFGHAGAISLAQGAFFGLGGYASGLLAHHFGLPFIIGFPAAILAAALIATAIALPVFKLESHYLALATLGLAELALLAVLSWESITGGANGLAGIPPIAIGDLTIGRGQLLCAWVWASVALGAWIASRWLAGFTGHALATMRADPIAAACAGLDVGVLRTKALVASAMYAAAAGALNVHTVGVVSPDLLGFPVMVTILAVTVIGGSRQISGAIVAALLLVHLPEWFRFLERHYLLAYGAAMLMTVVLAPQGLGPALRQVFRRAPATPPVPPFVPPLAPPSDRPSDRPPAKTRPAGGMPVLEIVAVGKRFGGVMALADISLSVHAGEILGLIGPNGSGKSTLLNAVSGLVVPDAGQIRIAGQNAIGRPPHRIAAIGVGRSFQTPAATGPLSALDSVAVAAAAGGARYEPARYELARQAALALLTELGAAGDAAKPCAILPPASRRRVEIARALARAPHIVLLDEPAAGLADHDHRDLALRLRRFAERGTAIVIVEHNLPFLLGIADRIVCLDAGRIIAEGSPDAISRDPRVIGTYLGETGTVP